MKIPPALLAALWLAPLPTLHALEPVTLDSLLHEMVDVESIARWPEHEFTCKQASSYDRKKVAPDQPGWFANHDNTEYIREEENEGRKEQVMMESDGPGTLVRFWLTAGGEKEGVLRVYLDDNKEPALTSPAFDLLKSNVQVGEPLAQPHPGYVPKFGGNTLFLPIPYAKHCKVTWEEKAKSARYYQINYRTYAAGTEVKTFSLEQVDAAKSLVERVNKTLASPPQPAGGKEESLSQMLPEGAEATLDLPQGPGAVRSLALRIESADSKELERTLRGIIVKLTFDDEVTAWCPATDFFGTAVGINELRSWYRDVERDGTMRCRWVMPYQKSAKLTLLNVGAQPVKATLEATTSTWSWDDRSMHFYAAWHYESGLQTPPASDWNFIKISGRGVYAGDSLALFNPVPTWYGEGDEKIWIDGESFPSHMGTGTEDYYGYSYAPKGIIQTPFNNQVRIDEKRTQGWNVMSRTRNLDGIPFHKSLQFDMELISWKPTTLIYGATTYWYAFPRATTNLKPQPDAAALPVPTLAEAQAQSPQPQSPSTKLGALECEALKIRNKPEEMKVFSQDMSSWDADRWSGGRQLTVKAVKVGDFIELEIPVPDDKPRNIRLQSTCAPDFGTLKFSINGTASDVVFDAYAEKVQPAAPLNLGAFPPKNGFLVLRIEVTGSNSKSGRYLFGLDYVTLETAP
jgi:hypothetical protein